MANSIKVTITVNEPVAKVWNIFMNPDYLKEWLTGFISVEHLDGVKGQVGSTNKLTFIERNRKIEVTEKILHLNPYQQYAFNMQGDAFDTLTDVRFISLGNVTEIIQAVQFKPKGIFMRLIFPFSKKIMEKRMLDDLHSLKKFIEKKK